MTATWDAADYAQHSMNQHTWGRELAARLRLRGEERLLDVGCGDGKITAELAAGLQGGAAVGTDASAEMIAFAQQRFAGVGNLRFEVADMRALRFSEAFDVVFSNAALHWVKDHRAVLAGVARALVPGGRVLLQMGGKGNIPVVTAALADVTARPRWASFFVGMEYPYGFYGPDEYGPWLAEAGLRARRVELLERTMRYPDADGFAGWFRTTCMPWTHRVPAELRAAFIADVAAAYLRLHPAAGDGSVTQVMIRLEVEATRK